MGGILSRWRKKSSTEDVLQDLQERIEALEESKKMNVEKQKRMIGSLILYSILLYIGAALLFYFIYFPQKLVDRLKYASPLGAFPILVWLTKRFLHWYFVKRIAKNEAALLQLKEQKTAILEDVMEKETYKKAKEILAKYDPERLKTVQGPTTSTPIAKSLPDQELRQRTVSNEKPENLSVSGQMGLETANQGTPTGTPKSLAPHAINDTRHSNRMIFGSPRPPPGPPMPRPVLPRERSVMDKVMDYLVGDGPQNRYALICCECLSHNGMALKEEYEYISFRCCYCYTVNPARKKRPNAPRLEAAGQPPITSSSHVQDSTRMEVVADSLTTKVADCSQSEDNRTDDEPQTDLSKKDQ